MKAFTARDPQQGTIPTRAARKPSASNCETLTFVPTNLISQRGLRRKHGPHGWLHRPVSASCRE